MSSLRLVRGLFKQTTPRSYSMAPCDILELLEAGYHKLINSNSKSLLKKHLTKSVFDRLKTKVTPSYCSTLLDCIQSGLVNHNSNVGIYAPDPDAYKTFADIFDPIIDDYHLGFKKTSKHPGSCFGYGIDFPNLDPERRFILSTRIRCARSVQDFPFNPCLSEEDYRTLECLITKVLCTFCYEHAGEYMPLTNMEKDVQKQLIEDHFLFKDEDPYLKAANASRFWPTGRGIFMNRARTFLVWVNEEDHIRIISMEQGGDIGRVYERLIIGIESLGHTIKFSRDNRLGYLTFCPTNLGNTIRASVQIRLPHLGQDKAKLYDIAKKHYLQIRGTHGEHSETKDGIYDVSNIRRIGLTEYQTIGEMYNGITAIIEAECSECSKK